jgi:NTP pyrophosphatase (non-canonical NTP hydrolase)
MTDISHTELVRTLAKSGDDILSEITAGDVYLLHMAVGVSGESGELLDAIKKAVFYRKTLDITNVIEELGDIEFYLEGVRQGLNLSRETILKANVEKLSARYKGLNYSNEAAINRADKA